MSDVPRPTRRTSSFGGDVLRLVSGTSAAQLITILSAPFITRLYPPSAFGLWALVSSITILLGVVACMRYELAIMLPESDEEAVNILVLSVLFVFATSLAAAFGVIFAGNVVARLLKAPELRRVLWAVPAIVFVNGLVLALNYWYSRVRHFGRLSTARVAASATSTAVQLGAGWGGHGTAESLFISSIAGSGVSIGLLTRRLAKESGPLPRQCVRLRKLRDVVYRYRKFPMYSMTSGLLNSISWQLPSFLLQYFFSTIVVGLYALGTQVLRVPMNLIGGAISQVFFQRAAAARASGQLAKLVEDSYRRLVTLSLAPMLVLGIIAADLFGMVFGSRWTEAGVYTQILAPWTFFWFISSPLSNVFSVLERQEFGLKLNVIILASRFLSLLAGGWMGSAKLAVSLFSGSGVLVYGYFSFAILYAAGVPWSRALHVLGSGLLEVAPIAFVLVLGKLAGFPAWLESAMAGISLVGFFGIAVRRDPVLLATLKSIKLPFLG